LEHRRSYSQLSGLGVFQLKRLSHTYIIWQENED
jgi:hypothetical protein